jgi:hypothetical protein
VGSVAFRKKLFALRTLVWFQCSLRWLIRAISFGAGGYLIGWSLNRIFGWLPGQTNWIILALIMGFFPLLGIPFSWLKIQHFAWRLDRKLGLNEQVSTAFQEIRENAEGVVQSGLIEAAFLQLGFAQKRILRKGWYLSQDLLSLLIIAVMAGTVFISTQRMAEAPQSAGNVPFEKLPALVPEPVAETRLPQAPEESKPTGETAAENPEENLNTDDLLALMKVAESMGENLTDDISTFKLGQALQDQDIIQAAALLDELAKKIGSLPDKTHERLAAAFKEGQQDLRNTNLEKLTSDLREAGNALETNDNVTKTSNSLAKIAEDLRDIAEQLGSTGQASETSSEQGSSAEQGGTGPGAGDQPGGRERGPTQEISRLQGEGEELSLDMSDGENEIPGILMPGNSQQGGSQIASGSINSYIPTYSQTVQNPLIPNSFSWNWRNVISSYFQPLE